MEVLAELRRVRQLAETAPVQPAFRAGETRSDSGKIHKISAPPRLVRPCSAHGTKRAVERPSSVACRTTRELAHTREHVFPYQPFDEPGISGATFGHVVEHMVLPR